MLIPKKTDIGVIVGRFQVHELHKGHTDLIDTVVASHEKVIIVLGLSYGKCTVNNPLDFQARQFMIQEKYPDITVMYIKDHPDDIQWSMNLDELIKDHIGPESSVLLYGSRDSFLPYYHGSLPTIKLDQTSFISGTEIRKKLGMNVRRNADWRAGVCWAMSNQWPGPMVTIDVAIVDTDKHQRLLLGRKKEEKLFRFIGGFVQNGETLSDAVKREGKEETGLVLRNIKYIDSFVSSDWRYKGERDKIITMLHIAIMEKGHSPEPGDDIYELRWFDLDDDLLKKVVPEHLDMVSRVLEEFC